MNKRTVLIVDDEEINRIILGKILSRDYNLLYASNGRLAMKLLTENSNTISAVLLDIVMPEMDGYEVLEAMRSDRNLAKIPVIISSQRGDDETEIKALSLGAHDFIAKPYKNDIIRHRLANMIEFRETAALVNTARLDELTGLYNKTYFQKKARELILEHPDEKYNMFYLDIERFKVVNDTFGAQAGDNLLCHIAANLSEIVGENGICARFNADDFYIFNSSTEALREEELISLISGNRLLPHNMNVKLRCGIYEADDIALPVSVMCDRAQLAAETIKGKYDRYIAYYDDSLRRRILVEQEISEQMEGALRDGQFHVYYQPKYELCSGRIAGAEALVRWKHPEHGMIPPGKFIPLFEKNGFITTLDMYIWEKVCLDLVELRESGLSQVPVSVNVSRADIYDSSLTDTLTGLVEKYKIPCGLLHLEITESAYAEDPEHIISVVSRLREYGFTIEMDDFGSGYSSLNMLSEMPIDVLKLDTRFIQREATKAAGKGILSFIISLAKWLGLSVVAEGVENLEQIITLKTMDCDYVQGFYYAHPMPKADFFSLLASENNTERKNSVIGRNHGSQTKQSDSSEGIMLIVDDTEVNRALLVQTFSDRYEIVETENGVEALEYLHENAGRVAIVMLDLLMPVMDGFQVLKQIRSNELTRDLPVIVTSQGDGASEARAFDMGADDFVSKPYEPEMIIRRVAHVSAHAAYIKIMAEKKLEEKLSEIELRSECDELTGLYNRTALEKRVSSYFIGSKRLGAVFIMIDIDNFKNVNDSLGHIRGDDTLMKIADILRGCFRGDDVICRMGGDEFSVFLPAEISSAELNYRLMKLCEQMRIKIGSTEITCSAGACVSPDYGGDYQTLYNNADMALLTAKRKGKNRYQIYNGQSELPTHVLYHNIDWLLDESADAVFICNAESYELLYMNRVAGAMTGKTVRDCIGRKCYEALWNENEPCSYCVKLSANGHEICEREVVPEGSDRRYQIQCRLIDWGGSPARLQYIRDNTKLDTTLRELKEVSEDRKRLLAFVPCGLFRYFADDENDRFDFISENMLIMLGYTRECFDEKFGGRFSNMVWHEDRKRVIDEINAQIAHGDTDYTEYRIEKSDGTLIWARDDGHIVTSEDGTQRFYVAISDITEQKKMEQRLGEGDRSTGQ